MKKHLTLLFTCWVLGSFAQVLPTKKLTRFQVGVSFSPDVCYRKLEKTDSSSFNDYVIDQRNEMEIPIVGYSGEVNVRYSFSRFFSMESGIQFSTKGYQTKKQNIVSFPPEPGFPTAVKYIDHFYYLDIPLKINFSAGKNKWRFVSSIGASANFLLNASVTQVAYYADKTDRSTSSAGYSFKKLNVTPQVSIGLDYQFTDKMSLSVEPTFRYGILKIIDSPITGYLFTIGLNAGYYLRF